mmetsp:Transcript_97971/g.280269  ORF Transcript_97971/g.280269 Transcript_97971/m.280269 type:complete len:87 (+) Transcript_97971:574-834(+)
MPRWSVGQVIEVRRLMQQLQINGGVTPFSEDVSGGAAGETADRTSFVGAIHTAVVLHPFEAEGEYLDHLDCKQIRNATSHQQHLPR